MQNGTKEAGGAPGKAAAAVETSLKVYCNLHNESVWLQASCLLLAM